MKLTEARRRADALAERLLRQEQQLAAEHVRLAEQVLEQAGRVLDAGLAASSALIGFPRINRPDPPMLSDMCCSSANQIWPRTTVDGHRCVY